METLDPIQVRKFFEQVSKSAQALESAPNLVHDPRMEGRIRDIMEMRDHVESLYIDFPTITADKCVFMLTHDKYGWHQKFSFTACDSALWEVMLDHLVDSKIFQQETFALFLMNVSEMFRAKSIAMFAIRKYLI